MASAPKPLLRPRMPRLDRSSTYLGQVTSGSTKFRLARLTSPPRISHLCGSNGFFEFCGGCLETTSAALSMSRFRSRKKSLGETENGSRRPSQDTEMPPMPCLSSKTLAPGCLDLIGLRPTSDKSHVSLRSLGWHGHLIVQNQSS